MIKMDYNPFRACPTLFGKRHPRVPEEQNGARGRSAASRQDHIGAEFLGNDADERHPAYLNWDHPSVPPRLRKAELPAGERLLLLDEIHKYARWRNLLKGIYDTERSRRKIIVTGSARLDYYRKGGDSLAGRYRYFRLHPFSLRELSRSPTRSDLEALLKFGGFPEPLFARNEAAQDRKSVV